MNYYYACLNYPVLSTLTKAINKGYFKGWHCLTSQQACQHITVSPESEKGHMDQVRQGIHTTQQIRTLPPQGMTIISNDHMADEPQTLHNICTNHDFTTIHEIEGKLSSNQTGCFPITSNRGNAYIVVFYVYDANYICLVPIKTNQRPNFYEHTMRYTTGSPSTVSNP